MIFDPRLSPSPIFFFPHFDIYVGKIFSPLPRSNNYIAKDLSLSLSLSHTHTKKKKKKGKTREKGPFDIYVRFLFQLPCVLSLDLGWVHMFLEFTSFLYSTMMALLIYHYCFAFWRICMVN